MIGLSLALGIVAPLLPGLAADKYVLGTSIPFFNALAPDLKPFSTPLASRSAPLIAGQCALAIISAALLGLRPSADGANDTQWRRILNRTKLAYSFLLFPEFLVWQAIRQSNGAQAIYASFGKTVSSLLSPSY